MRRFCKDYKCGASIITGANACDYERQRCILIQIKSKTNNSSIFVFDGTRKDGKSFISKYHTLSSSFRGSSFTCDWTRGRSPHPSHVRLTCGNPFFRLESISCVNVCTCRHKQHITHTAKHSQSNSYCINIRNRMLPINISSLAYYRRSESHPTRVKLRKETLVVCPEHS